MSDGGQYWSYRQEGNIGIWEIHDWEQLFETELPEAEQHYSEEADRDEITASIVQFDSADALGGQMQDHITEAWSQLAQSVNGIERTAYVATESQLWLSNPTSPRPIWNSHRLNRLTRRFSGRASDDSSSYECNCCFTPSFVNSLPMSNPRHRPALKNPVLIDCTGFRDRYSPTKRVHLHA